MIQAYLSIKLSYISWNGCILNLNVVKQKLDSYCQVFDQYTVLPPLKKLFQNVSLPWKLHENIVQRNQMKLNERKYFVMPQIYLTVISNLRFLSWQNRGPLLKVKKVHFKNLTYSIPQLVMNGYMHRFWILPDGKL